MGCYIWYTEEGPGRAAAPPSPLLAVPNVTAHPSTASVPITVLLSDGPLLCGFNVGIQGLIPLQKWTRQPTAVFQTSCTAYRGREGRAMGLKPPVENFYLPPNKVGEAYSKLWAQLDIMCLIKVHFKIKLPKLLER